MKMSDFAESRKAIGKNILLSDCAHIRANFTDESL